MLSVPFVGLRPVTGGIAANYGFTLPVRPPPNAIAFGSGEIERDERLRAGVVHDVLLGLVTAGLLLVLLLGVGVLGRVGVGGLG